MLTIKTQMEKVGYFRRLKLTVKGRLIGDWAEFLGREVSAYGAMGYPVLLDLSGVEEIDAIGHAVLRRLAEQNVETIAGPSFNSGKLSVPSVLAFSITI